jgi:predicted acetyltransferase
MTAERAAVSITKAGLEDKVVVANLIQLYLYDLSADLPFPIGRDGRFEYDFLDRFWQHPYLIHQDDELAGFALVINGSPVTGTADRYFMAEFFVLKAYRGKRLGSEAFEQILQAHSGKWQVGVIDRNKVAQAFWAKAIGPHQPASFSHQFDGENWLIYEFEAIQ